ncbi:MAG: EamA family transporter RarD [Nocardioidaceae bacterium]
MPDQRRGLVFGVGAYAMWGLFPLYWPLLEPAAATEILAHRVLWSLLLTGLMLLVTRRMAAVRHIWSNPRVRWIMIGAGFAIGCNWFTYIWGVNNGHVVEASLGYYINPLVTVLMGVLILGERLRRWQWVALSLGAAAVVVLSLQLGRPPWISLVLAASFGTYGLLKKKAAIRPMEGVAFESMVLAPFAFGYLCWLSYAGQATAWSDGAGHALLLTTTGIATVVPLLCFAGAANRVPLSTVGLLQYITPTMQFFLGVFVFHESMPATRWFGFAIIWLALVILSTDSLVTVRRRAADRAHETLDGVEAVEAGSVLDSACTDAAYESPEVDLPPQSARTLHQ